MNRRNLLYHLSAVGLAMTDVDRGLFGSTRKDQPSSKLEHGSHLATPSPEQQAWQDLELGMFVHFAPNTWQDVESDNLSTPLSEINPEKLSTDQWAETAIAMGARYIVFVAKHQGGFCMWRTQTTAYGIRNTPWKVARETSWPMWRRHAGNTD